MRIIACTATVVSIGALVASAACDRSPNSTAAQDAASRMEAGYSMVDAGSITPGRLAQTYDAGSRSSDRLAQTYDAGSISLGRLAQAAYDAGYGVPNPMPGTPIADSGIEQPVNPGTPEQPTPTPQTASRTPSHSLPKAP